MMLTVECHSGCAYAERPLAFPWQGARLEVASVLARERIPEGRRFRVRTRDGQEFELTYLEQADEWRIQQP